MSAQAIGLGKDWIYRKSQRGARSRSWMMLGPPLWGSNRPRGNPRPMAWA